MACGRAGCRWAVAGPGRTTDIARGSAETWRGSREWLRQSTPAFRSWSLARPCLVHRHAAHLVDVAVWGRNAPQVTAAGHFRSGGVRLRHAPFCPLGTAATTERACSVDPKARTQDWRNAPYVARNAGCVSSDDGPGAHTQKGRATNRRPALSIANQRMSDSVIPNDARAASSRATGTRNGEQDT